MDASKQHLSVITIGLTAGQLVTAIQAVGAIQTMKVNWEEPLSSMMSFMALFSFDLDLFQLPCVFGADSPVTNFVVKLLIYPCFAALLFTSYNVSRLVGRSLDPANLKNLNGMLLFVLYISLALSIMLPFQCQTNPSGPSSMATHPGIRCFEDQDHWALTGLAVVGILVYPVGILVWVSWATFNFKQKMISGDGVRDLKSYRFLFARFKPECYYFGVIFLVRNALVAMTPVVFVQIPAMQSMAMATVLLTGHTLLAMQRPWRTNASNYSDLGIGFLLLLLITGSATLLEVDKKTGRRSPELYHLHADDSYLSLGRRGYRHRNLSAFQAS
jgi:hypothetical protein